MGGCAHPDELFQRLTSFQIAEWGAFERLEPFGTRRLEYCFGMLASVMANIHRDPKKSSNFSPKDFTFTTFEDVFNDLQKEAGSKDKKSEVVKDIFRTLRDEMRKKKNG